MAELNINFNYGLTDSEKVALQNAIESKASIEDVRMLTNKIKNMEDYTAFEVYATNVDIPVGSIDDVTGLEYKVAAPANMTHRFMIKSRTLTKDSDVIVDWGDGTVESVKDEQYWYAQIGITEENKNTVAFDDDNRYVFNHTYTHPGRYIIKIFGKAYGSLRNAVMAKNNGTSVPDSNILCRCFSTDLPIAQCVNSLASFVNGSIKLLRIDISEQAVLNNVVNFSNMCNGCVNLQYAYGFSKVSALNNIVSLMFLNNKNLIDTDLVLPSFSNIENIDRVYEGCVSLEKDINELIPTNGFVGKDISVHGLFRNCSKLTGTVPAKFLWGDPTVSFKLTTSTFKGCSDDIRSQVPQKWGGTVVV